MVQAALVPLLERGTIPMPSQTKRSAAEIVTDMRPAYPTKTAQLVDLLHKKDGVTLADLAQHLGWLPHTTRAALTGLRKKGHVIVRERRDGYSLYRIMEQA